MFGFFFALSHSAIRAERERNTEVAPHVFFIATGYAQDIMILSNVNCFRTPLYQVYAKRGHTLILTAEDFLNDGRFVEKH